jgi:hypothetical protein
MRRVMIPFRWFMVLLPGTILVVSTVHRDWRSALLSAAVMAVAGLFIGADSADRELGRLSEQLAARRHGHDDADDP